MTNFYDVADRLAAVRDPMGFVTSNRYDQAGRVIAVVNPRGFAVSNSYDQAGNLISRARSGGERDEQSIRRIKSLSENDRCAWIHEVQ